MAACLLIVAIAVPSDAGDVEAQRELEQREAIAEQRLEEMLEGTPVLTPASDGEDTASEPAIDAGRFPQIRVPLDEPAEKPEEEPDVNVGAETDPAPDRPAVAPADPVPPPHDAEERGLDPLTE